MRGAARRYGPRQHDSTHPLLNTARWACAVTLAWSIPPGSTPHTAADHPQLPRPSHNKKHLHIMPVRGKLQQSSRHGTSPSQHTTTHCAAPGWFW